VRKLVKEAEFNRADGVEETAAAANQESRWREDGGLKCMLGMKEVCGKVLFSEDTTDPFVIVDGGLTGEWDERETTDRFPVLLAPRPPLVEA